MAGGHDYKRVADIMTGSVLGRRSDGPAGWFTIWRKCEYWAMGDGHHDRDRPIWFDNYFVQHYIAGHSRRGFKIHYYEAWLVFAILVWHITERCSTRQLSDEPRLAFRQDAHEMCADEHPGGPVRGGHRPGRKQEEECADIGRFQDEAIDGSTGRSHFQPSRANLKTARNAESGKLSLFKIGDQIESGLCFNCKKDSRQ
jgi:hypothetical protein